MNPEILELVEFEEEIEGPPFGFGGGRLDPGVVKPDGTGPRGKGPQTGLGLGPCGKTYHMDPRQFASKLRQIAYAIDNSREPSKQLVVAALKHLIAGVEEADAAPPFVTPAEDLPPNTRERPRQEPCDHYRLVREGGRCPVCGEDFKPNFGNYF